MDVRAEMELPVTGRSMEPFLHDAERVPVVLASADEIEVGDLVVIERGPLFVLHRAVRREGDVWRTRGDAWSRLDPVFPGERLIGRVPGFRLGAIAIPERMASKRVRRAIVAALPWLARVRGLVGRVRGAS